MINSLYGIQKGGSSFASAASKYECPMCTRDRDVKVKGCQTIVYVWTDLVQFAQGVVILFKLPKLSHVTVQTWFQLKDRDVFVSYLAIKSILSSRVCCQIATNAHVARDPDNNLLDMRSVASSANMSQSSDMFSISNGRSLIKKN